MIECEVTDNADEEADPYPVVRPYETVEVEDSFVVHVIVAEFAEVEDATDEITGAVTSVEDVVKR